MLWFPWWENEGDAWELKFCLWLFTNVGIGMENHLRKELRLDLLVIGKYIHRTSHLLSSYLKCQAKTTICKSPAKNTYFVWRNKPYCKICINFKTLIFWLGRRGLKNMINVIWNCLLLKMCLRDYSVIFRNNKILLFLLVYLVVFLIYFCSKVNDIFEPR